MLKHDPRQERVPHRPDGKIVAAFAALLFEKPHECFIGENGQDQTQTVQIESRINFFPGK